MHMYGGASTANTVRLVLEIFYVLGLLWNVYGEACEMMDHVRMEGTVLGYFGLVWNWADLFSLALQFTAIAIWMVLWRAVEAFDMQPRYNIYYSLLEMPRYWAVPNPPTGFMLAAQAFVDLRYIINLRAVYFALQGINLFLMMVRLLKFMDFQPYLGVITRSLALATPSLLHFFLLSFAVFFCFSMYAYLVFGGALEQFSTVLTSMFSCFLLLLNDNSSTYFFQRLESWDLIAAMLFFFMFIVLMVFILLNFLIAIIVDAFMSVKDSNVVATSITSDIAHVCKYKWNCWWGRYMPYSHLLQHLVNLGAKDTRLDEADRLMRRFKSIRQRVGSAFSVRVGSGHRASASHFTRADSHPAFPAASVPRVRKQHVLTVKEKRINAISLSIILQRRLFRERSRGHQPSAMKPSDPLCSATTCSSVDPGVHDTGMEELSQALVLQCGEVVKQSALPVKKPVQKLSLACIKEEVVRSQHAVEEVRGMVVELQGEVRGMMASVRSDRRMTLLFSHNSAASAAGPAAADTAAGPPLPGAAVPGATAAGVSASMVRPSKREPPPHASPMHSTLTQRSPEHRLCQKRLSAEGRDEGDDLQQAVGRSGGARIGAGSGGVEGHGDGLTEREHGLGQKRLHAESRDEGGDGMAGDEGAAGDLQQAVGSSSGGARIGRSLSGKRGSGRRVSFRDGTMDDCDDEGALNRKETQQQSLIEKAKYY
ncbi:unnamed protein product [Closterium sp. Naga37s-1]|nr:unnamed protein product [Closterium sp. Naga37s-1]